MSEITPLTVVLFVSVLALVAVCVRYWRLARSHDKLTVENDRLKERVADYEYFLGGKTRVTGLVASEETYEAAHEDLERLPRYGSEAISYAYALRLPGGDAVPLQDTVILGVDGEPTTLAELMENNGGR